jgi:hypothetical protein
MPRNAVRLEHFLAIGVTRTCSIVTIWPHLHLLPLRFQKTFINLSHTRGCNVLTPPACKQTRSSIAITTYSTKKK